MSQNNDDTYVKCWVVRCRQELEEGDRTHLAQEAIYMLCEKHRDEYWKKVDDWIAAYREFGDEDGNNPIGYRETEICGLRTIFYAYPLPDEIIKMRIPPEYKKQAKDARKWRPEGAERVEFELKDK